MLGCNLEIVSDKPRKYTTVHCSNPSSNVISKRMKLHQKMFLKINSNLKTKAANPHNLAILLLVFNMANFAIIRALLTV